MIYAIKPSVSKVISHPHFKNFKNFFAGGIIAIILGYVSNFLINKNLSTSELGLFSYYFNIMVLLTNVLSLGIFQAYLRFNTDEYNIIQLKKIIKLGSIVTTLIVFIISYAAFKNILISSFSAIILFNERIYFYRSALQIRRMNFIKYLSSLFLILFLFILIKLNLFRHDSVLLGYGLAYLIIASFFNLWRNKSSIQNTTTHVKEINLTVILKYTIPLAITSLVTWVASVSDQMIIKEYLTPDDLGNYAISYRIIIVIRIFTSLFLLYFPMLYFEEAKKQNFSSIRKIRLIFIVILMAVTIFLIFFRNYLYIFLGASNYLSYTSIFIFLAIAEFIKIISELFLTFRSYSLQTYYSTIAVGAIATVSVLLNLIFIPIYGIYAAAVIQVISAITYLTLSFFIAIKPEKKYFNIENKY